MTSRAQGLRVENVLQTGNFEDVDQQMTTFGDHLLNIDAAIVVMWRVSRMLTLDWERC
jgi:hypothetical protein